MPNLARTCCFKPYNSNMSKCVPKLSNCPYITLSLSLSLPPSLAFHLFPVFLLYLYIYIFFFSHHYLFLIFASMSRDSPIIICHYFPHILSNIPQTNMFFAILPHPHLFLAPRATASPPPRPSSSPSRCTKTAPPKRLRSLCRWTSMNSSR